MSRKTGHGLAEYAVSQLGKPYWWGTYGQIADLTLLREKRRQYPEYYSDSDFPNQFGQKVHDCCGLIKGYRWCDTPSSEPRYVGSQDVAASGLYHQCSRRGDISTMPDIAGVCLFRRDLGHVAVYIGNGKTVEAMGHRYGVVERNKNSRNWAFWGMPDWIDYGEGEIKPPNPRPSYYYNIKLPLLKPSMEDGAVKTAQRLLNAMGYDCTENSVMDEKTVAAVKAFQGKNGLLQDGEIGIDTWTALLRGN